MILDLQPIAPEHLEAVFDLAGGIELIETWTAWGGVPRYWELATESSGSVRSQVEHLVLDPLGPLHREPDRLLIEELPSAVEARPVLDAIGAGVHRISEIAGRLGRPATSMARPLERLIGMGLVRREVPFGELEKKSRARGGAGAAGAGSGAGGGGDAPHCDSRGSGATGIVGSHPSSSPTDQRRRGRRRLPGPCHREVIAHAVHTKRAGPKARPNSLQGLPGPGSR